MFQIFLWFSYSPGSVDFSILLVSLNKYVFDKQLVIRTFFYLYNADLCILCSAAATKNNSHSSTFHNVVEWPYFHTI